MSRVRNNFIDSVDECVTNGVKNGIFQVSLEDNTLNGRTVTIGGREVVNYGSCSYLGLEVDDRLKQGAIDATIRYGTQYSSSRAYSSCNLYEELEDLCYKIFDNTPAILAATTTLTHIAAIPILVSNEDLVILDHQVHGSVQVAVQLAKAKGTKVQMIRHNRMDILEDLIKENPNKYNKIWYMADGLYSMYGDYAPLKEIEFLMEKYPNFHLYIDDAHGMSWTGRHGNGYVMSQMPIHPKMVLTTSLAKAFGTGGGLLIMSDKEMLRKILSCGSSYTLSGPVQPPMLGASIASAKIHLSDEIYTLQNNLKAKLALTQSLITEYDLPLVYPSNSPIFYIGLGLPRTGYNMVKRLLNEGYYTNIGVFPAVPVKNTGLRLPISNSHTAEDIKGVLEAFSFHLPKVMEEEGINADILSKSFNLPFEATKKRYPVAIKKIAEEASFTIQLETTIEKVDKELWNQLLGDNGIFDWEGCRFLEKTFCDNPEPENNWNFHYLIIKDQREKPVLATFFTELLCKDDMIAPANVSEQVEEIRKTDKYYLTSKVIMMGSLITVGDHVYLDRKHPHWKKAFIEMLRIMNEAKQRCGATSVQLRDFDSGDVELRDFLIGEGFVKAEMPDVHTMSNIHWHNEEEYLERLSTKGRWHFRRKIADNRHFFKISVIETPEQKAKANVKAWFNLYENVQQKSYNINTYKMPFKYFDNMLDNPSWEIVEIRLNPEEFGPQEANHLAAVGFCYKSGDNYSMMAVGLDYNYVLSHGCYRQALYQSVVRASQLRCDKLFLGMDASIEKQRFGLDVIPKSIYIQANDNYNMELISSVLQ